MESMSESLSEKEAETEQEIESIKDDETLSESDKRERINEREELAAQLSALHKQLKDVTKGSKKVEEFVDNWIEFAASKDKLIEKIEDSGIDDITKIRVKNYIHENYTRAKENIDKVRNKYIEFEKTKVGDPKARKIAIAALIVSAISALAAVVNSVLTGIKSNSSSSNESNQPTDPVQPVNHNNAPMPRLRFFNSELNSLNETSEIDVIEAMEVFGLITQGFNNNSLTSEKILKRLALYSDEYTLNKPVDLDWLGNIKAQALALNMLQTFLIDSDSTNDFYWDSKEDVKNLATQLVDTYHRESNLSSVYKAANELKLSNREIPFFYKALLINTALHIIDTELRDKLNSSISPVPGNQLK